MVGFEEVTSSIIAGCRWSRSNVSRSASRSETAEGSENVTAPQNAPPVEETAKATPSTSTNQSTPSVEVPTGFSETKTRRVAVDSRLECRVVQMNTRPFVGQKPGTSGLRKRVPEFRIEHYAENFVQCVLDGGLGLTEKVGAVLVVDGDGRFLCPQVVNVCIKIAAANGLRKLIVAKDGLLSTPAFSLLIRSRQFNGGAKIHGGIILTASHNPGGPTGDFGIKFNCENGGPAPDAVNTTIFELSETISEYNICHDLDVKLGSAARTFTILGPRNVPAFGDSKFTIEIADSVTMYAECMEEIFDFPKLKTFLAMDVGIRPFQLRVNAMSGAAGPYVLKIFEKLGLDRSFCLAEKPREDFGGRRPDPHPRHAAEFGRCMILGENGFFVTPSDSLAVIGANLECIPYFRLNGIHGKSLRFARSMPTGAAIDRVARARKLPCYEVPTGWKYFGNLMDAGKLSLCGEESFGTGSDHIREKDGVWAFLAWLQILAERQKSVVELVQEHWFLYGRNAFMRYDYEDVDASGANLMMTYMESLIPECIGHEMKANNEVFKIIRADNFEYTDPIDGSVARNQGIRIFFEGDSRIVFRLSGTSTVGTTIRIYLEKFLKNDDPQLEAPAKQILESLGLVALQICKLEQFTGRTSPTVIT
ncbi:Phosphoglucomutase [Aphelenchoides fujianensis]|nr:Phosphoglucomutase [Aphelenchoides fujianensis]